MIDPNYNKRIDTGTRVGAMFLDHIFMIIIAMIFFIPGMIIMFANAFKIDHTPESTDIFGGTIYLALVGFAVYLCKDCINGRSLAKRLLKLQVVDNITGEAASPLKCLVRNIFIFIWPIEVIVGLVNPSRRIGDRVAGTKLIAFDPSHKQPGIKVIKLIPPFVIAYGLILLLMVPYFLLQKSMAGNKINYIESSYNNKLSKETEKLFTDSLGSELSASVKVYDKIQGKPLSYVSVIFRLKKDQLNDEDEFAKIKSITLHLLYVKFPERTIKGQAKYVFQTDGSSIIRSIQLNE